MSVHRMYSLIQPLRRNPKRAETRLRTKLRNQIELIRTAGESRPGGCQIDVKGGSVEGLFIWIVMRSKIWAEVCVKSSCRDRYDSMTNAVNTAENNPAYLAISYIDQNKMENDIQIQVAYQSPPCILCAFSRLVA